MTSSFTTGATLLPDVGQAAYNGCTFSPLFASNISATAMKDEANRTVKYTEMALELDGYVTMGAQATLNGIAGTMANLHQLLTAQGGALTYKGRGWDISLNQVGAGGGGGGIKGPVVIGVISPYDVAWGPVPELIEFQPMGGGLSAKVKWKVTLRFSAIQPGKGFKGNNSTLQLLQFNYETDVTYGEDGYSTLSVNGSLEIPMTRSPNQASRTVSTTADDFRAVIERRILNSIDLSRFRITHRSFPTSRDKRTLTWSVTAEEKPYMDLPPSCTVARGSYNVRPAKTGPGLCLWLCTLQATYTVRADSPRRTAYVLFLALLRLRMAESTKGNIPNLKDGDQEGEKGGLQFAPIPFAPIPFTRGQTVTNGWFDKVVTRYLTPFGSDIRKPILLDFNFSEGLYLDSKTITFSATWRICTTFSHILLASGVWTKLAENFVGVPGPAGNLWATTMRDISGSRSWMSNQLNPAIDVIVDFGSTE